MTVFCGNAHPAEKKLSNAEIASSLDKLATDIADLKTQVYSLTNIINDQKATTPAPATVPDESIVEIKQAIQSLHQSIVNLENRLNGLTGEQAQLQKRLAAAEQRTYYADSINYEILTQLVILENRLVSLSNSISDYNLASQTGSRTIATPAISYKDRYLNALSLHQNGKYEESIELFRKLIAEDRNNDLADNAQYWIGESYYSMKQYQRAVIEFEKVSAFSNTDKNDDAQYKIGLCYKSTGDREKAQAAFQKLIDLYPRSEFTENAKQLIK
ncbi:MAG: tetratricopeptide repeat protein [Candidatus Marinimicrobia bacterium]|jgi:tol-pal system protein YbgF|nr:tetratricopeptide repeat protein [Candidatus Neomarinimicrobiota bacterium]MDD5060934.1 tetratricopeptide repeat protein [Candidatus Neomarinimicrobiota bacterium]MDD5539685.1 tetratricopeptide repeat protein [Candidatus Neomarinimicrobiota bacterium]